MGDDTQSLCLSKYTTCVTFNTRTYFRQKALDIRCTGNPSIDPLREAIGDVA